MHIIALLHPKRQLTNYPPELLYFITKLFVFYEIKAYVCTL